MTNQMIHTHNWNDFTIEFCCLISITIDKNSPLKTRNHEEPNNE